jgi:hypothetical protein
MFVWFFLLIAKKLKNLLIENFGNKIMDVILFSFQQKGKATDDSVIDVLFVLKDDYNRKMKRKTNVIYYNIDLKYEIVYDTQIISLMI